MGQRFGGVLVHCEDSAVIDLFRRFRPQVVLHLTRQEGLVGISRYTAGEYWDDYRQLAEQMSRVAGMAVVYSYDSATGTSYERFEKGRLTGKHDWQDEDSGFYMDFGASYSQIESMLCFGEGELVCFNLPTVPDLLRRLNDEDFAPERLTNRARLMKQAETAQRLIDSDNTAAAGRLLRSILSDVQECLVGLALNSASQLIEATLEELEQHE